MTWVLVVLGLFALLGWRLAYLWWAETKQLEREKDKLKTDLAEMAASQLELNVQSANQLACAQSIILRHAISGKVDQISV